MNVSQYGVIEAVTALMKKSKQEADVAAENFTYLPNGGIRITLTIRPSGQAPVNPYKVGTIFQLKTRTYKVVGHEPNRRKFSVRAQRRPDGRIFLVPPRVVQDGFLFVEGE